MMRLRPRHSPSHNKTCTAWLRTLHRWAVAYLNRKGTLAQIMNTTACKATEALPALIYKAARCTLGGITLIPCQLRALCSTSAISPIPHRPVWTTAVLRRFQATTTMDPVTPIPHTQTSPLTMRLREGFRKRLNSRICKDSIGVPKRRLALLLPH